MTRKVVVVTGATGFIGRHILAALTDLDFAIHSFFHTKPLQDSTHITWHQVDFFKRDVVKKLLQEIAPTHLIHAAGYTEPGKYWQSPLNLEWLAASLQLAREFAAVGGKKFIGIGSCAEYDWKIADMKPWAETHSLNPDTLYGISKVTTYQVLKAFFKEHHIDFVWTRLFYPFGPFENEQRLIPAICRALLKGQPALCSAGDQVKDFIAVQEVGRAIALLADAKCTGSFNVGSGTGIAVADIAREIAKQLHKEDLLRLGVLPKSPNEPSCMVADITKLQQAIDFQLQHDFMYYLKEAVAWWQKQSQ